MPTRFSAASLPAASWCGEVAMIGKRWQAAFLCVLHARTFDHTDVNRSCVQADL